MHSRLPIANYAAKAHDYYIVYQTTAFCRQLNSQTCSSFEDRTFAAAGPQVWNSLPPYLRLCGLSYGQFRRILETVLFRQWCHGTVWTVL